MVYTVFSQNFNRFMLGQPGWLRKGTTKESLESDLLIGKIALD